MSMPIIEPETQLDLTAQLQATNFSQFEQVLPKLKDFHSKYQTQIVHDLTKISNETEKIIGNLNDIEKQITLYQTDIDDWANKINTITTESQAINATFMGFQKKVHNYQKLRDEFKRMKK